MVQRSPENLGNNATFGLIVTDAGAVLIDPGGTYKGAAKLAAVIKTVTDKPVKIVINSGGQDHRWLGNGYFKERGARIIASSAAVEDHQERANGQLQGLEFLVGKEGVEGTQAVYADETFEESLSLDFGGVQMELIATGGAHTPGDAVIWLPESRVAFTGDMVYLERMLGVGAMSDVKNWIPAFEAMAALKPLHIVPGHGNPSTLERAKADTYDYLVNLNKRVLTVLENGGEIADGIAIDQDAFKYLLNFDQLARRNAQEAYMQLEFDF
ncbi:MAG: MBL fold metallo-hydrolase [Rhodospirillaceae bacterium]|jgi:glyoxylase-like metal-dependent hydrolase (beta-lactamase superfamily II)|nr:MBL fold metallo-hydrolase [Rhodospirillaceae bacterium]MBT5242843.1 MBL fold metallo-hydrolase [Rhodospirillaceae bacterium]MBT5561897.1 MBL fold metallo-hydrolase [Rhodospirillaceae bacterium]MBT6241744.1 MBL fold metallo-hydrolase [Rhodospirillaceae bacterium]MBT7137639.1 MBL fold metallo-hydrolase [Rhodospirillaceae bacterium]